MRKFSQALAVDAAIHKRSTPFDQNELAGAQNLQTMRYRRVPDGKMFHDVANADRLIVSCPVVGDLNATAAFEPTHPRRQSL